MEIRRRLLKLSRLLGSFPSLGYALIYLALIPGFAIIYYGQSDAFYHSTIHYEKAFVNLNGQITDELYANLSREIEKYKPVSPSGAEPNLTALDSLEVTGKEVSFRLRFMLVRQTPFSGTFYHANIRFKLDQPVNFVSKDYPNEFSTFNNYVLEISNLTEEPVGSTPFNELEIERMVFPFSYPERAANHVIMHLGTETVDKIKLLSEAYQGSPKALNGQFGRMFYLSAVTITTVGYGDIVPLTTPARILVSLEAILGIILMGLFLNSLSYERAIGQKLYEQEEAEKSALSMAREQNIT